MKKILFFIALALTATTSFGQSIHPTLGQQPDTIVNFETPYSFYADASVFNDTASKLAVKVIETLKMSTISYTIFSTKNKALKSGSFMCTGSCFTMWSNNRSAYNEASIVSDSALHNLHPIQ